MSKIELLKKINKKKVTVGIIGLGYVGLPLFLRFIKAGYSVCGIDQNKKYLENLRQNKNVISGYNTSILKKIDKKKNQSYKLSHNFKNLITCDVIIICLPTPLDKKNNPDLSIISNCAKKIKSYFKENQLLILESTIYPGVIEKFFLSNLSHNLKLGQNFFLGFSPEREDPGNKKFNLHNIPKVCSGITGNCVELTKSLYQKIVRKVVLEKNINVATMSKLFENVYRNVNIALVNELKFFCHKINIDVNDVLKVAATKPFGFKKFEPGPGVGGHCIPIDPFYYSFFAKTKGFRSEFVHLSGRINKKVPLWISQQLSKKIKFKNLKIKKVLFVGLTYKKNIDDLRESPSLILMNLIKNKFNFKINYYDPFIKKLNKTRNNNLILKCINFKNTKIENYDLIILAVDHDNINYKKIYDKSKIILDLRNKYKKDKLNKIIKL